MGKSPLLGLWSMEWLIVILKIIFSCSNKGLGSELWHNLKIDVACLSKNQETRWLTEICEE